MEYMCEKFQVSFITPSNVIVSLRRNKIRYGVEIWISCKAHCDPDRRLPLAVKTYMERIKNSIGYFERKLVRFEITMRGVRGLSSADHMSMIALWAVIACLECAELNGGF
jgi:hypothetical protein